MARFKVHLDHAALERMLKEQFRHAVEEKADRVGEIVQQELLAYASSRAVNRGPELADSVEVTPWETDRARPAVRIAHPAGMGLEARDGVLTKAAAEVGLEVKKAKP